MKLEGLLPYG